MSEHVSQGPGAEPDEPQDRSRRLRRLLATLGAAMVSTGQPTHEIELELREVATALGAAAPQVAVAPTGVHVALDSGDPSTFQAVRGSLRLDQSAQVRLIRHRLLTGVITPEEAQTWLNGLPSRAPAYPAWVSDLGFLAVGIGICLILQPGAANVAAAAVGSLAVVGQLRFVRRHPSLLALLPTAAGFAVALLVVGAAELGWLDGSLRTILPALAVLLPGALIVTGLSELAAGAMIAGTSRLLYGTVQLLMFTVGITAAAALLSAPSEVLTNIRVDDLGWWVAPIGLLLIGAGIALMESVPLPVLPWVFATLTLTFVAQFGGQHLGEPILGTFVGAIVASLGPALAELVVPQLPRLIVFLPSFWLLVPGSLGLLGASEIAVASASGSLTGAQVPAVVLAIAVGLLVGSAGANAVAMIGRSMRHLLTRPAARGVPY